MVAEHGTAEEQITYLAQQPNAMQKDVAELQNALQGSAKRYADLMVPLFTSESRVKRMIAASDEVRVVMSRLQALETKSTGAMTSVAQTVRGKEATQECHQKQWMILKKWTGDCTRCSFHAPREKRRTTSATLKDRIQDVEANGQLLRSVDGCGQVCFIRRSDTPSEPERTDIRKTQDAAECQTFHADVGT